MKFLIFNLMVLSCLGYLVMSNPNENFVQWASKTKEKVSNLSREDFLEKINNAVKSKNDESNLVANDNQNLELKYSDELMKMVKKELSHFDKKLEIALQKIPAKDTLDFKKNNKKSSTQETINKPINKGEIDEINDVDKDLYNKKIFMSNSERSNALAELITDIELDRFKD
mgnify:CR=1 FL=1|jgi:hypothetical protein